MLIEEAEPEAERHADPGVAAPASSRADTLAASVMIMLVMTVAQRFVGFGRGMLFCRWLDAEALGEWDIAFGFLNLAAPLVVLGLPGSFGRYAAYFRQRGQFHTFFRRTTIVCAAATALFVGAMIVWRGWFANLIFGTEEASNIVVWLAMCLALVILHNTLSSMFIAVRMYRIVTILTFVQSLGFAVISLGLLAVWPLGATGAVIGYGVATVLSAAGSYGWLRGLRSAEQDSDAPVPQGAFWAKLLPFAMWMWVTNLLANLFEVVDRYMIVHHSGMPVHEALREVGNYHTARILPLLFGSVAALLGSIITPHLSHDWELGHKEAVVRRLNMVLKLLLISLFAASIGVLCGAPLLFNVAFGNKYPEALGLLPLTLTYCAWCGTLSVAQNYLWCVERPGLNTLAFLFGLVLNIGLNLVLLPALGLEGAVWAKTAANIVTLSLIYLASQWHGMKVDFGTWIATALLMVLPLGAVASSVALAAVGVLSLTTEWILTADDRRQVQHGFLEIWHKVDAYRQRWSRRAIKAN